MRTEDSFLKSMGMRLLGWIGLGDADQKMRDNAANWLELAEKVWNFRRDQLTAAESGELLERTADVRQKLKERAPAEKLKLALESLEDVLRRTGGAIYPKGALVENVEFFLVAAIVILGIRTYFVQPFKIPTNSMWPTYYGMTHETFQPGEAPGPLARVGRLLAYGATRRTVVAPADGELMVPIFPNGIVAYNERPGRTMLVFPTVNREYIFRVAGQDATVQVPLDFSGVDEVMDETYGHDGASWRVGLRERINRMESEAGGMAAGLADGGRYFAGTVLWVPVGRTVHKGEPIVTFDVLTGDLLFVERISYQFVRPEVGQAFVFKTENIRSVHMQKGGEQIRSYYVKRLVGTPGDTLEVRPPVLYRNGAPITGAAAFDKNARRETPYPGYTYMPSERRDGQETLAGPGETVTVPPGKFYAMGDNSPVSADSRYWGFVPDQDVVGRPLFIYYPVSRRWGPAR